MDNKKYMCYVTYAIELDGPPNLPQIEGTGINFEKGEEMPIPPSFVMDWFQAGKYPEDDIE